MSITNYPSSLELLGRAASLIGVREIVGAEHEGRIVSMLRAVGIRRGGDETPWCAAFVNWILERAGVDGTGSARARSFLAWGQSVPNWRENIKPGDIVVLWRKNRRSSSGHVAFFQRWEGKRAPRLALIGGNQGDRVSSKLYRTGRVLDVRRQNWVAS